MPISSFREAQQRYAALRRNIYDRLEAEIPVNRLAPAPVRLADIDEQALNVWRATWTRRHWSGSGNWDWEALVQPIWRRPAGLPLAIWSGDNLLGLAVGHPSKRRPDGFRHTFALRCIEASPDPGHPLRRMIVPLTLFVAERYGTSFGAERLRVVDPLPGLLHRYLKLGFAVAGRSGHTIYLEAGIDTRAPRLWKSL